MKVRSSYFKIKDMEAEVAFWRSLLQIEPAKSSAHWSEFMVGSVRIGGTRSGLSDARAMPCT